VIQICTNWIVSLFNHQIVRPVCTYVSSPDISTDFPLYLTYNWICNEVQVANWLLVSLCYWSSHLRPSVLGTQWTSCTVWWFVRNYMLRNVQQSLLYYNSFSRYLCNVWLCFTAAYLTTLLVSNILVCQKKRLFINYNLH
jgi:hypothetical protein